MFRRFVVFAACLSSVWLCSTARSDTGGNVSAVDEKIYDIPRTDWLWKDTTRPGWCSEGLEVRTMCCVGATPWPKATPAPSMRVTWSAEGLLARVVVHHAHPYEFDYVRHLFKGDSIEFFVSVGKGSRDRYMLIISPGIDPRYPEPRHCFFADPSEEAERDLSDLTFQCNRARTADGYVMNVLLPWSNLHIQPATGMELALQVYVMEAEPNAVPVVAMWNPAGESYIDPRSTMRIRLGEHADAPFCVCATAQDDSEQNQRIVRIVAPGSDAGRQFEVRSADGGAVYGELHQAKTQSVASLSLPARQPCAVLVDSVAVPLSVIPPVDDLAVIMSQKLRCQFSACVFQGAQFPRPFVEGASHYHVAKVDYYDAAYTLAQTAAAPGRYGAVIEIADGQGKTSRRFRTLFRVPDWLGLWRSSGGGISTLPEALLADANIARITPLDASGHRDVSFLAAADALANPDTAAVAACLFEKQNSAQCDAGFCDYRSVDRQWWVGLKRKLNGWDRQFPQKFVCPTITAQEAPVVQPGTLEAAGVSPAKVAEIDSICSRIVQEVGEPISICLVRRGVIFFHHAYGQIAGRPLSVDDPCDIQSATKPLGGALMMEVLGSGAIGLDETIDHVLPSFRGIPVKKKMIVRDLYDHLSGLTGDWGDQIHDTDEIIAGYYSAIDVGNYSYNEVGFALGGKIIEAVSGEAFPQFAQRHLLAPLGMDHTRVTNGGGHNATTALDYAKFGQMLLNRGAYGHMRFFTEKTFDAMLPTADGTNRRGIGLIWMNWQKYGFSPGTFGHNAGNSSILAVDPAHDLVVVIVSGGKRKDFAGRAEPFYRAVINALD